MLTNLKIARALANRQPKPFKLWDGRGLSLLIPPTGRPRWALKFAHAGKDCSLSLGVYDEVGVKEARDKADDARRLLRDGINPAARKQELKRAARQSAENDFETVALEWHAEHASEWLPRTAQTNKRLLERFLIPPLRRRPVNEIDEAELAAALRKVKQRTLAPRVLAAARAIFAHALATGRAKRNPAVGLQLKKAPKAEGFAALPEKELPDFLKALDAWQGDASSKAALQLLLLTAVRSAELLGARWDEFDLDAALWTIPAARMKGKKDQKREHIVPLSKQAVALLRALHARGVHEYVFVSPRSWRRRIGGSALLRVIDQTGYKGRMTPHGCRALFSTLMNERGEFNRDAVERALAHVAEGSVVRRAYMRGDFMAERRELMQAWADTLDALAGRNVVAIKTEARA